MSDDMLTPKQVAVLLAISPKTVYDLADRLPRYRFGRCLRFRRADVEKYQEACRLKPARESGRVGR